MTLKLLRKETIFVSAAQGGLHLLAEESVEPLCQSKIQELPATSPENRLGAAWAVWNKGFVHTWLRAGCE